MLLLLHRDHLVRSAGGATGWFPSLWSTHSGGASSLAAFVVERSPPTLRDLGLLMEINRRALSVPS